MRRYRAIGLVQIFFYWAKIANVPLLECGIFLYWAKSEKFHIVLIEYATHFYKSRFGWST
jgi:hypothetical protein